MWYLTSASTLIAIPLHGLRPSCLSSLAQDDTKNHGADWTPDLGYLLKPSRDLDIAGWADRLQEVAADFRKQHHENTTGWRPGEGFEEDG